MNAKFFKYLRALVLAATMNLAWPAYAAESFNVQSAAFLSAVKYGLAYSVLTSGDLNYWDDPEKGDAFTITQKIHEKLGQRVKVNVFGHRQENGFTRISVEFPDFQVGRFKFILDLVQMGEDYTLLGHEADFVTYQFDFKTMGAELELPKECRPVVTGEFALTKSDIKQIQSWFKEFIKNESPKSKGQLNHIFVAPYSKKYNASFRVYWVEGQQVIEFDRLWMKDHPGDAKWFVRMDYNDPLIAHPKKGTEGGVLEGANFELATCVRDGSLISVGP